MATTRIIFADDSQFIREAYKRILETQSHFEIVGIAEDGEEAVRLATELSPDVAILDIRMPKLTGIEAAGQISAANAEMGIIIISAYDDLNYVRELLKNGPRGKGYILKTSLDDIGELIRVVEAVANGGTVLDPELVQKLVRLMVSKETSGISDLNATEREVYELLVGGYEDAEIARTLRITQEEVREVTSSATLKLGIPDAGELDKRSQAVEHFINRFTQVLYESEPD
jgi:DNA-binding NarL/FixJ family response regulator|tara:strand:- start:347 stop:1033 length:687 start_codon:yes stop_codon:yes gene_type:complete